MKISTNTRYALRFLAQVAQADGARVTTAAVARAEGISEKMLERIAAKLCREGFVISLKGIRGGYLLSRPAGDISVTEVLTAMETPYLPHHCVEHPERDCRMFEGCGMLCLWQQIDNAIRGVTDAVSIADIVRSPHTLAGE